MNAMNKSLVAVVLFAVCMLFGCASYDRINLTKLEPITSDSSYKYFKYSVFSPPSEDVTSPEPERQRLEWLEWRLEQQSLPSKSYEIIGREVVVTGNGALGKAHRLFYTIKVPSTSIEHEK